MLGVNPMINLSGRDNDYLKLKRYDTFLEIGVGCDFYTSWFKFCPEITYRIGFADQLCPVDGRMELAPQEFFYTNAIKRLTSSCICLTFNFE